MKSEQQKLIEQIMSQSVGTPFLFSPEEFGKGPAVREPADLVWACNGCVMLFYLASEEKTYGQRTADEQVEHNLGQAGGWLRAWRAGEKLVGKNPFREFAIAHDAPNHIVVISVIDATDGYLRSHDERAEDLKISRCATFTETALHMLANAHASMFDILQLIEMMRGEKEKGGVPAAQVGSKITQYTNAQDHHARKLLTMPVQHIAEYTKEALGLFQRLRSQASPHQHELNDHDDEPAESLNDLQIGEFMSAVYGLAYLLYKTDESAKKNNSIVTHISFEFPQNKITVTMASRTGLPNFQRVLESETAVINALPQGMGYLWLQVFGVRVDTSLPRPIASLTSLAISIKARPSRTEILLGTPPA